MKLIHAITIAALSFTVAAPAFADDDKLIPSVSVTGTAKRKIAPDQAVINVTALAENANLNEAKKNADDQVKKILAIAEKNDVAKEKMEASNVQVQPLYDYRQNSSKPIFRAYQATTSITLTLTDIAKASVLVDEFVKAGIERVGGIQFGLADEKKVQDDILIAALQDAKARAEKMTAALGVKLGKPLQINESGDGSRPPIVYARKAMMASADMAAQESAPELPSGQIEVQKTVNVTFEIQ